MPELGEIRKGGEVGHKLLYTKLIWDACPDCGKERWVNLRKGKPDTRRCRSCEGRRRFGEKSGGWKGGHNIRADGYIRVKIYPDDFFYPMANSMGYVMEHRLVVAKALNRCLLPWEIVHHKGKKYPLGSVENKQDNRYPENLEIVRGNGRHNTQIDKMLKQLLKENTELKARLQSC